MKQSGVQSRRDYVKSPIGTKESTMIPNSARLAMQIYS